MSAVSLGSQIPTLLPITEDVEEERRDHSCSTCQAAFTTPSNLRRHLNSVHAPVLEMKPPMFEEVKRRSKSFSCSVEGCESKFTQKHTLTKHLKKMHGNNVAEKK